jgi:hypothetical protein
MVRVRELDKASLSAPGTMRPEFNSRGDRLLFSHYLQIYYRMLMGNDINVNCRGWSIVS